MRRLNKSVMELQDSRRQDVDRLESGIPELIGGLAALEETTGEQGGGLAWVKLILPLQWFPWLRSPNFLSHYSVMLSFS